MAAPKRPRKSLNAVRAVTSAARMETALPRHEVIAGQWVQKGQDQRIDRDPCCSCAAGRSREQSVGVRRVEVVEVGLLHVVPDPALTADPRDDEGEREDERDRDRGRGAKGTGVHGAHGHGVTIAAATVAT